MNQEYAKDFYRTNRDGTVAIDPYVSYYSMATVPYGLEIQLHTVGGRNVKGRLKQGDDLSDYQGWRPFPQQRSEPPFKGLDL